MSHAPSRDYRYGNFGKLSLMTSPFKSKTPETERGKKMKIKTDASGMIGILVAQLENILKTGFKAVIGLS